MYIDGKWLECESTFDVCNPATGEVLDQVADGTAEHATLAVEAADRAFDEWSGTLHIIGRLFCIVPGRLCWSRRLRLLR